MKRPRSGWLLFWSVVGATFAVVLLAAGLITIGFYVFLAIGMNAYASNK